MGNERNTLVSRMSVPYCQLGREYFHTFHETCEQTKIYSESKLKRTSCPLSPRGNHICNICFMPVVVALLRHTEFKTYCVSFILSSCISSSKAFVTTASFPCCSARLTTVYDRISPPYIVHDRDENKRGDHKQGLSSGNAS